MNHVIAIMIAAAAMTTACSTATSGSEVISAPRAHMRVLSETQGKGPGDELSEEEHAALVLARDTLATRQSADSTTFVLVTIQSIEWSDASLGCPQPRRSYMQVVTPGHRVVLRDNKHTYRIHVAKDTAIICQDFGKAPFQRTSQAINARSLARMQQEARRDLAAHFNVSIDAIKTGMLIPSQWPDASLGCPAAGVHYPPGVRNGFRIILKHRDRTVFYHTDGQRVFPCPAIEVE
jgi:hypothetical protein